MFEVLNNFNIYVNAYNPHRNKQMKQRKIQRKSAR